MNTKTKKIYAPGISNEMDALVNAGRGLIAALMRDKHAKSAPVADRPCTVRIITRD